MRCLFFSPRRYSFNESIVDGLRRNNIEVDTVDYEDFFNVHFNSFIKKSDSLPYRVKSIWKDKYIRRINQEYFNILENKKPDLVIIYNNQNFNVELLTNLKKHSKIVFLLGDNPLYSPTNIHNIQILFLADYIISPDSFWIEQLRKIGIKNLVFDCFGIDHSNFYKYDPPKEQKELYSSDLIYVGNAHKNNWGYKRFLFLDQFKDLNLKAYISGDGYYGRWKSVFPELEDHIIRHDMYNQEFNNMVFNCSRIYPIETVPSLLNGIHIRVFEALGAGILPLCEYTKDLEMVFSGIDIPLIRTYPEAEEMAKLYLEDEMLRLETVQKMKDRILENYSSQGVIARMLSYLFDH